MWKLTIFVALFVISNYHCFATTSSSTTTGESLTNKEDELLISSSSLPPTESSSASTSSSSLSSAPTSNIEQIIEITSPEPLQQESTTKRRQITYDQRQEGQYNIRADLENFMIVVIPPNPVVGVNLLDLITRSSLKRSNSKKLTKKEQIIPKFSRPSISKVDNQNAYDFIRRMHQQSVVPIGGHQIGKFSEFVEGRTPYKVDISSTSSLSSDRDISKMHSSESQVDVLPPSYPFHLHLMKPYHLEAEPTVVQSPSLYRHQYQPSAMTQGKFMDYFNNFGSFGTRRNAKSIKDHHPLNIKELETNSISINDDGKRNSQKRNVDYEGFNIGGNDHSDNHYYDNHDSDAYSLLALLNSNEFAEYKKKIPNFDEILMSGGDDLKLIGATEQCGPDGVRDSYGKCLYFPEIFNI